MNPHKREQIAENLFLFGNNLYPIELTGKGASVKYIVLL